MLHTLYPFTGRFLYLDGIRYHYLDEGAGEPIVMLHGNPTWSFYFRNLVVALRPQYRLIVPDHIGCGRSDKPSGAEYPYTLARRVQDLEFLLDHLQLPQPLTLVVHDWGGMIGLAYAVRHPERIGRLVILNTAAFALPPGRRFPWQLQLCRLPGIGALLVRGLNLFCKGALARCSMQPLPAEVRAAYLQPHDSWRNRIAVLRFVEDIPLGPSHPSYAVLDETQRGLERLQQVPMLICWGERDFIFDQPFLEEWQRRFPAAEVERYPDAGHWVLEDAGEEIAQRLQRFLTEHPLPIGSGTAR